MIERNNKIEYLGGIAFRDRDKVFDCNDIEPIENLNSLPFADYSDFNLDEYTFRELPISTSRGCINRCAFCSESGVWKRFRSRSAENIFEEIRYQLAKYPYIRSFFFNDSLINGNIKVLNKLCELLIKERVRILWGGQGMIREEMTKEFIAKMRKAGFSHVSYGLESASPRILKMMGKRFTPQLAEEVIRNTKRAGVHTYVNIIIGFPGETEEDRIMTADFLRRNKRFIDEIFFHPLVVSRGSHLYQNRDTFGIDFENEFNPNTWYSTKEENTLQERLEWLDFYKRYIGGRGESFFTLANYYSFLGDDYFNKGSYREALRYYLKAEGLIKNRSRDNFLHKKIELTQKKISESPPL
jgi:radical SAM superfamily enzyme YgiQ (UPF0313 family)